MGYRGFVLGKALISKLFSDPCSAPPFSLRVCGFRAVAAAREAGATAGTAAAAAVSEEGRRIRKVGVFWDLDNKPPKQVPPFVAALHLRNVAGKFGEVVDVVAYANRHAFSFLPQWVKEQRKDRKLLDKLETAGVVKPREPYICGYCGCKCRTNEKLKKHFRDLHERERTKRMNRMDSMKGKRRLKYKASLAEKEERYRNASKEILVPKVGYGLASELRRAGVYVRRVEDKPQAADEALKSHMARSIKQGLHCICLVSDDSDFSNALRVAQQKQLRTVVVGDTTTLSQFADIKFSWEDVASGKALARATEAHWLWSTEDALHKEYMEDCLERREGEIAQSYLRSEASLFSEDEEDDCLWEEDRQQAPLQKAVSVDYWWMSDDDEDQDDACSTDN